MRYAPAPLSASGRPPATQEDLNAKRRMAQAFMQQATDASPVGHWTQALARAVQGISGGMASSQAASGAQDLAAFEEKQSAAKRMAEREAAFQDKQRWDEYQRTQEQADPMYQANLRAKNAEIAAAEDRRSREKQFYDQFNAPAAPAAPTAAEPVPSEGVGRFAAPSLATPSQPAASMTPRQLFDQLPPQRKAAAQAALQTGDQSTFMKILTEGSTPSKKSVTELKQIYAADDAVPVLDQTVETLKKAEALISKEAEAKGSAAYEGTGAGWAGYIGARVPGGSYVFDETRSKSTDEWGTIMNMEAIKSMAENLKGATTNFELQEFVRILADPSQPREIRRRTLERMRSLAEKQSSLARRRAEEIRSGEYYRPEAGGAGATGVLDLGDGFSVEVE